MHIEKFDIFGVRISKLDINSMLGLFEETIRLKNKITVAYANAHTLNMCYDDSSLVNLLNSMDFIHPDGIGVFRASRYLCGERGMSERFTGSDFYPELVGMCIKNNFSIYFFGHSPSTLKMIKEQHPSLKVSGTSEGYDFDDHDVLGRINDSSPDILIIGLSFPIQEKWMLKYKDKLNCKVILAVGDGIKVFSGEKIRGPRFMRELGLEWLVRVFADPLNYSKRYIAGIPLFMARVKRLKSHKVK